MSYPSQRARRQRLVAALLLLDLLAPPRAAALPTSGSTLSDARGVVPGAAAAPDGDLRPDLWTGAATYAVPLVLAPATGGMTPELVLRYASSARADAWVGFGWSLGLSSIARSLASGTPSYDDARDEFVLDGQQLIADAQVPGRYHTERESFVRIDRESDGSWTVRRRDGIVLRFGTQPDARVEDAAGRPFEWLQSEQEDPQRNVIVARYDRRDPGTAYLAEIRYGLRRAANGAISSIDGDPARDRSVSFVLDPRDDAPSSYLAGFQRVLGHRLASIDVRAAGELLRRYTLRYRTSADTGRSLLVAVALHGADANAATPTPPFVTAFDYRSNVAAGHTGWRLDPAWSASWPANLSLVRADRRDDGVRLADVDGDGLPDLVKGHGIVSTFGGDVTRTGDSGVYLNTGAGFSPTPSADWPLPVFTGVLGQAVPLTFANEFPDGTVWGNGVLLTDVTGDGRADTLGAVGFTAGTYPAYHGPLGQSYQGQWCQGSAAGFVCTPFADTYQDGSLFTGKQALGFESSLQVSFLFADGNTQLADLDGDALPELVVRGFDVFWAGNRCSRYAIYSYVVHNQGGLRFARAPLQPLRPNGSGCDAETTELSQSWQPCDAPSSPACAQRLAFSTARWVGDDLLFSGGHFLAGQETRGSSVVDLNGDGLADTVAATRFPAEDVREAWLNVGAGAYVSAPDWRLPEALQVIGPRRPTNGFLDAASYDTGLRFADLNGDGRLDLVRAREGDAATASWLNDGDTNESASPSPWVTPPPGAYVLPPGLAFSNAAGQDLGLRLVDVNGDGMTDLVRSFGATSEVWLHEGALPDLLESVTNPFGGTIGLAYTPSGLFLHDGDDGKPDLPLVLPLLTAIETRDGVTAPARTTFVYRDGRFDPGERVLRGFREVVVTAPEGRTTTTRFHQDAARAGLTEWVTRRAADGALWEELRHEYTADDDGAAPWRSLPAATTRIEWDGAATARRTRTLQVWDVAGPAPLGNLLARSELGEVDANGVDLDPSDTLTTELVHAPPASGSYLVDRVARRRVHAGPPGAPGPVRESLFFYDGDTTGSAAPTRGLVTRRRDLLGEPGAADPETRFTWDAYGNLTSVADARTQAGQGGGTTRFELDPLFHAFRVAEVNALGQRSEVSNVADTSCAFAHPRGAGLAQVARGPNELAAGTRRIRCHDPFGRPTLERAPLDLAETRWLYGDAVGAARVTRSERATSAGGLRQESTRFDGFGRPIEVLRDGPQGRTTRETRQYDASGRVARESGPDFLGDPTRTTAYAYDALDRRVETTLPGSGRIWRASSAPGLVTFSDPTGHVVRRYLDGRDRVVAIAEVTAAETLVTQYRYNAFGEPTNVLDARSHATLLVYDLLGRRRLMIDPDAGAVAFGYDANGNVVLRSQPLGTAVFAFDALDRPRERRVNGVLDATWSYDTAIGGAGRFAARQDAAGLERVLAYDALGRPTIETIVRDGNLFAFQTVYDALGQVESRTLPSGQRVTSSRDARGHLRALEVDGVQVAAAIDWDASGRLAGWEAGNALRSEARFDPVDGRLAELSVLAANGAALERLGFGYDAADRVLRTDDRRDAARSRSFSYDEIGRLAQASGPYAAGAARIDLHYAYDAIGNLVCKDATALAGCIGGTRFAYPTQSSAPRPHAPLRVNDIAASYDSAGNLVGLGDRAYGYDGLGQLVSGTRAGSVQALHVYDAAGRRARAVDRTGVRPVTRQLLSPDFEWDATRRIARTHVQIAGLRIATVAASFTPGLAHAPPATVRGGPQPRAALLGLALASQALGALLLALAIAGRHRRGAPAVRTILSAVTGLALSLAAARVSLGMPDGDLNGDRRLDAADWLLAWDLARGTRQPAAGELDHGDVAPLELAPQSPPRVDAADAMLLLRALRAEDLDGDGVSAADELAAGASPFRFDSDRDGLSDADERLFGSDPARADSDGDGASDGLERVAGTDPTTADTDGDGFADGADPQPLGGILYRFPDALGTPVLVARADGQPIERPLHRPFGDAVAGTGGLAAAPFGFTGQRFEPGLGLLDYGARFYDPALGRFLQPDTTVPDPLDPQSLHRYAYVRHDPLRRSDPTGRSGLLAAIFGAVVSGLAGGPGGGRGTDDFLIAIGNFAFGSSGVELSGGGRDGLTVSWGFAQGVSLLADGFRKKIGAAVDSTLLWLSISDLKFGDVLLTRDGGSAQAIGRLPTMEGYGHGMFVLGRRDGELRVASSDNRGRYLSDDSDPSVGGRSWDVFRTGEGLNERAVNARLDELGREGGLNGGTRQYLADRGANVCTSFAAELYTVAGGRRLPLPEIGPLVTPGEIARRIGPPIGRVPIPLRFDLRAVPEGP